MSEVSVLELELQNEQQTVSGHVEPVVMCKCASCRKEIVQHRALVCMQNQMHRYVCNTKCMNELYT